MAINSDFSSGNGALDATLAPFLAGAATPSVFTSRIGYLGLWAALSTITAKLALTLSQLPTTVSGIGAVTIPAATFAANVKAGSDKIIQTSQPPVPVYPGQALSGTGIPAGAIILSVFPGAVIDPPEPNTITPKTSPATVVMSAPATADGTGVTITAAAA